MEEELQRASEVVTLLLNSTKGLDGWPTRCVAERLVADYPNTPEPAVPGEKAVAADTAADDDAADGGTHPETTTATVPLPASAVTKGVAFKGLAPEPSPGPGKGEGGNAPSGDEGHEADPSTGTDGTGAWDRVRKLTRSKTFRETLPEAVLEERENDVDSHIKHVACPDPHPSPHPVGIDRPYARPRELIPTVPQRCGRHVAEAAFLYYDTDHSGVIEKEELFACLTELGQVAPSGPGLEEQRREFLETNFALADTNGDGVVDVAASTEFYTTAIQAMEHEKQARTAFAKYDLTDL